METLNRRKMLKKLIGVSVGTTIAQVLGVGQSLNAITALADVSSNSENINILNYGLRLDYDFLSPISKGIGGGIGEFSYSIGEAGANTVRGAGEAGGNVLRGIGEGLRERLRDIISNAEGKRKLIEFSQQQDLQRKREIIELMRDSLREDRDKQIALKLTEIQSNWDLQNWNGVLSRQETEDLLKQQKDCLVILMSPPEISIDAPASIRNNLQIELNELESFLVNYYPDSDRSHQVKFYSDYFKRPIGNINVDQLQKILAPVPTVILDLDVTDYTYKVKVHFWGVQNNQRRFYSSKVWNWERGNKELISKGAEEKEALRTIRQTIVNTNKFLAAYIADLYYLNLDPYYEIKFPKISAELNQAGLDDNWLQPYVDDLKKIQLSEQKIYESELKVLADATEEEETIRTEAQKWKLINTLSGHSGTIHSIAISPDGQMLVSSSDDKTIKVWNLKTGELLNSIEGLSTEFNSIAISPDGQMIVSSNGKTITLWSLKTGELLNAIQGHSGELDSFAISPDGQMIASSSTDNTMDLWSLKTGKLLRTIEKLSLVAFSRLGYIVARDSNNTKILDLETGKIIRSIEGLALEISPDGQKIPVVDSKTETIKLWNLETGNIYTWGLSNAALFKGSYLGNSTISPDGRILVNGDSNGKVKLWNLKTGELLRVLEGHSNWISSNWIYSVAISPNGHTLASGRSDKTIEIWSNI
ncbi:WD40 repeat domain-containing protein [Chamaesiphon minutus]|uniref:WD40 repeat-containing protein n=1 Tax=Chamaesiphon minutus (strain ATCC 27169 / PCC 6605) TaxID=1173020 RepID=K9UD12_CHAP6|nr:WD40 repeat domain-containing protein [Chamaesiphon minutus]AFY92543.1 WD40 repeat-containing protein [Chamaesiphon minutus PCC 6605]